MLHKSGQRQCTGSIEQRRQRKLNEGQVREWTITSTILVKRVDKAIKDYQQILRNEGNQQLVKES